MHFSRLNKRLTFTCCVNHSNVRSSWMHSVELSWKIQQAKLTTLMMWYKHSVYRKMHRICQYIQLLIDVTENNAHRHHWQQLQLIFSNHHEHLLLSLSSSFTRSLAKVCLLFMWYDCVCTQLSPLSMRLIVIKRWQTVNTFKEHF